MRHWMAILLLGFLPPVAGAPARAEHVGRLDRQLMAGNASTPVIFAAASAADLARLPRRPRPGSRAFAGSFTIRLKSLITFQAIFIEPPRGLPAIYVDLNRDGAFTTKEVFRFSPSVDAPALGGEVLIELPVALGRFRSFPLRVGFFKPGVMEMPEGKLMLTRSIEAYVSGTVKIAGRPTRVRYGVQPETGTLDPARGWQGIDSNGDGKIDGGRFSPESAYASGERVVFRAGDRFVSTRSLDPRTGRIVLEEHPASAYRRIELRAGAEVPDFPFVDFEGAARRLSEFRGKVVLLDFWGTWCGPCVAEVPRLKAVYEKYRHRGFEILGMDVDDDVEKVRAFLREQGAGWTQATPDSVRDLIEHRFHINVFPTYILIDREGRIVSFGDSGQLPLHGPRLAETLETLLGAHQ